jgi:hypothetical protein
MLREPMAGFWSLLFPAFSVGALAFVSYAFAPDDLSSRSQVLLTLVLTIVAFKFVIASKVPSIPYLTIVDYYCMWIFNMFGLQLLCQTIASLVHNSHPSQAIMLNRVSGIVSAVGYFLLNVSAPSHHSLAVMRPQIWILVRLFKANRNMPEKSPPVSYNGIVFISAVPRPSLHSPCIPDTKDVKQNEWLMERRLSLSSRLSLRGAAHNLDDYKLYLLTELVVPTVRTTRKISPRTSDTESL